MKLNKSENLILLDMISVWRAKDPDGELQFWFSGLSVEGKKKYIKAYAIQNRKVIYLEIRSSITHMRKQISQQYRRNKAYRKISKISKKEFLKS